MIGKAIELLAAVAVSAAPPVAAPVHQLAFTPKGIGQVEIGQRTKNATALAHSFYINADGSSNKHANRCDLRALEGSDNSYAWIINSKVMVTGTSDPDISLPSGLSVGMTTTDMKRLEPSLKLGANVPGDSLGVMETYYGPAAGDNQIRVTAVDGEITEIAIGGRERVTKNVTC